MYVCMYVCMYILYIIYIYIFHSFFFFIQRYKMFLRPNKLACQGKYLGSLLFLDVSIENPILQLVKRHYFEN